MGIAPSSYRLIHAATFEKRLKAACCSIIAQEHKSKRAISNAVGFPQGGVALPQGGVPLEINGYLAFSQVLFHLSNCVLAEMSY